MLVVRPISKDDYDALHTCAVESGHGFTSLPVNEELLTNRINHSVTSFTKPNVTGPGDEGYLMVGFFVFIRNLTIWIIYRRLRSLSRITQALLFIMGLIA